MYAQIVSKNLISILSYQSFICSRYFEKSTISLKHNSPIHTFQKLFPFAGSTQRSKGKKPKFPFFIQSNIWAYCDEIALDLIYSFNMWWQPTYLMSHSGAIKIHLCSTCITENGVFISTDIDTNI